jgi:release factor glutamine methyltransferase
MTGMAVAARTPVPGGPGPAPAPERGPTVRTALLEAAARLRAGAHETPVLDATVLLAHALGISKERLFAAYPEPLPVAARARFRELVAGRAAGVPVAYLRGCKEFYGRRFLVDRQVLIPRPETEMLVGAALRCGDAVAGRRRGPVTVHDVGTGSGAIAATLQLERPQWRVSASDLAPAAVAAAARNCRALGAGTVRLRTCDLLPPAPARWDLIVANLPYLTTAEVAQLRRRGWPEPPLALDGGADGLEPARRLLGRARARLRAGGFLVLETAAERAAGLAGCLERQGYAAPAVLEDLAGLPRVVVAQWPS